MPTFSEMKSACIAVITAKYTGRARQTLVGCGETLGAENAWQTRMYNAVCHGDGEFPEDADESPVAFSSAWVVHDSVGGGVMLEAGECAAPAFRVSAAVAGSPEFVTVKIDGEIIALTIEEAFRRGLCEVPLPRKTGRRPLPLDEKLVPVPVRLSPAQKAKLQRIGPQRLREWLDRVKE